MLNPTHRATWYPVLGTQLWLSYQGDPEIATHVEDVVLAAFERGDELLSTYRRDSALNRWRHGDNDDPPHDVVAVLAVAADWWSRSGGAVNPDIGRLADLWTPPRSPSPAAVAQQVAVLATGPGYRVADGMVERLRDCSRVTCDAVAKGWIIDSAVDAALAVPGVRGVSVVCGGDLRHAGTGVERVRIEDPRAVSDNAVGLGTLEVSNQALATSANTRRGATVAGTWRGHVIDPRTGVPVEPRRQASVLAPTAATADAGATAAFVLGASEAPAVLIGLDWLIVEDETTCSAGFSLT